MKQPLSFFIKTLPPISGLSIAGSGLNKAAQNMGWLLFERIFRIIIGLTIGVWVARYLQPEKFGTLSYAFAFTALFSPIAKLGLDGITVRELVKRPGETDTILGSGFALKLAAGALTVFFACSIQYLLEPLDRISLLLVGIVASGCLFQAFDIIDLWFQSRVQSKYAVISRNISFTAASAFRVLLIFLGAGLVWFALAEFLGIFLGGVGLAIAYLRLKKLLFKWRISLVECRRLLGESWPVILQSMVIIIYMRVDQIMLKSMVGSHELGIYSVSVKLTEFWYFIPMILTQSLFPAIIRSKELGEKVHLKRIQALYTFVIWLAIGIAGFVTIFSDDIVRILFGESFTKAGSILAVHTWMGCSVFFGVARQKWIMAENKLKAAMYLYMAGCTLNVLGNLVLIPLYGALGSAVSSLCATVCANFLVAAFSPTIRYSLKMYAISLYFPFLFIWRLCSGKYNKGFASPSKG